VHAVATLLPAGDDDPAAQLQFVHAEPAREYFPAGHCVHAVATLLPAGDDDPATQLVHTAEPVAVLYFPG
jgi:hypothetical protein